MEQVPSAQLSLGAAHSNLEGLQSDSGVQMYADSVSKAQFLNWLYVSGGRASDSMFRLLTTNDRVSRLGSKFEPNDPMQPLLKIDDRPKS